MILTKCRLETGSLNSLAPSGNSRSSHCLNSGVPSTWSRLRQYWRPVAGVGSFGGIVFILTERSKALARAIYDARWMMDDWQKRRRRPRGQTPIVNRKPYIVNSSVACRAILKRFHAPVFDHFFAFRFLRLRGHDWIVAPLPVQIG